MFENKKIKELEKKLTEMEERQITFIQYQTEVMKKLTNESKAKFMYDIRREDVELMEDGRKLRKIRTIIE